MRAIIHWTPYKPYETTQCFNYTNISMTESLERAQALLKAYEKPISSNSSISDDRLDLLISIWKTEKLLKSTKTIQAIPKSDISKEDKKNLLALIIKLEKDEELTHADKVLFEQNLIQLTHLQKKQPISWGGVTIPLNESTHIDLISKSVDLAVESDYSANRMNENIEENFIRSLSEDLNLINASTDNPKCEIIIVADKWETDTEICNGIIMRDKAHEKKDRFAIIITETESNFLVNHLNELNLQNIYKISTLRHTGGNFPAIAQNICHITAACSEHSPCKLKEIVLRECFSAGSREKITPEQNTSLPNSNSAMDINLPSRHSSSAKADPINPKISTEIEKILNPYNKFTKADWYNFKERSQQILKTKSADSSEQIADTAAFNTLKKLLKENQTIESKIPSLSLKGYYGYVTPYGLSDQTHEFVMRSVDRSVNPLANASQERLFKAVRANVFDSESPDLPNSNRPR